MSEKIEIQKLNIVNGFKTASEIIYQKDIFIMRLNEQVLEFKMWEVAYSPSMGMTSKDMHDYLDGKRECPALLANHLEWLKWLKTKYYSFETEDKVYLKGPKYNLTTSAIAIPHKSDFIKIKADKNVPLWVFDLESVPKVIVIDYNLSSTFDDVASDVEKITKKFGDITIYIEEPFVDFYKKPRVDGVRYIYDNEYVLDILKSDYIFDTDVISLKMGRNTPEEYEKARSAKMPVMFTNILTSKLGEDIINSVNNKLGTFVIEAHEVK